jgi:hypothetical protein
MSVTNGAVSRLLAAAVLTVALLSGCVSAITAPAQQAGPSRGSGGAVVTGRGGPVLAGRGWRGTTILGPIPAPGSCHLRYVGRQPLPDPRCTPGAIDSAVTQANLRTTACRKGGYTASVRPPLSATNAIKRRLLAAYGIPASDVGRYELDHLIELSGGGSSDVRNLWPEPNVLYAARGSDFVRNDKDQVETYLFHAQCSGKASLSAIQQAVSQNWTTAVAVLGLPPIPAGYRG